ncbi:MAG: TetR/AcrR family transcriptional regulator C-terminal domain-containing protein [Agathobacter sp.]
MSKYTRRAIVEAFMKLLQKKSLDKITVKEIIESAEINRNTFYYYFQDIYDLLENMFRDESERFRSESDPNSTFLEEYMRLAAFFQEHRDAIIHIYNSKSRDVLTSFLEAATSHFVSRFISKKAAGTSLSKEGEEYITYYYTYGIIGLTMRWIERQMPDYREGLIQTISASFEATIEAMIQSYIEGHPKECK